MSAKLREFQRAIDEILWKEWDPIGGAGAATPRDEYSSYVPQVLKRALAGDRTGIAEYLSSVEENEMGLGHRTQPPLHVADSILKRKAEMEIGK